jgi:hypothetical protein
MHEHHAKGHRANQGCRIDSAPASRAVSLGLALQAVPSSAVLSTAQDYAESVARLPRAVPPYLKAAVDAADVERSLLVAAAG